MLTHATAAISFITLQTSEPGLIRSFGRPRLLATAISLVAGRVHDVDASRLLPIVHDLDSSLYGVRRKYYTMVSVPQAKACPHCPAV